MFERHDLLHLLPQPTKGYQISLPVSPVLPGKQKCPRTIPGRAASRRPGPPKTTALMNLSLEMPAYAFCRWWTFVGDGHTRCTGRRATKGMRTSRAGQERHAAIGGYGSITKEIASMTTVCSLVDIGRVQAGCGRRCSAQSFTMLLAACSREFVPHRKMKSQRQQ